MKEMFTLEPFTEKGHLNVIIETPKGSRNKYAFDEKTGIFRLKSMLPLGAVFPFDFGFIPSTQGEDGDPLDVLVLMDEPAYPGILAECRLVGAIEADQTGRDGGTAKNDRLIAIADASKALAEIEDISELNEHLLDEIEHFFISYNRFKGKRFSVSGRSGHKRACQLVEEGRKRFRRDPGRE